MINNYVELENLTNIFQLTKLSSHCNTKPKILVDWVANILIHGVTSNTICVNSSPPDLYSGWLDLTERNITILLFGPYATWIHTELWSLINDLSCMEWRYQTKIFIFWDCSRLKFMIQKSMFQERQAFEECKITEGWQQDILMSSIE